MILILKKFLLFFIFFVQLLLCEFGFCQIIEENSSVKKSNNDFEQNLKEIPEDLQDYFHRFLVKLKKINLEIAKEEKKVFKNYKNELKYAAKKLNKNSKDYRKNLYDLKREYDFVNASNAGTIHTILQRPAATLALKEVRIKLNNHLIDLDKKFAPKKKKYIHGYFELLYLCRLELKSKLPKEEKALKAVESFMNYFKKKYNVRKVAGIKKISQIEQINWDKFPNHIEITENKNSLSKIIGWKYKKNNNLINFKENALLKTKLSLNDKDFALDLFLKYAKKQEDELILKIGKGEINFNSKTNEITFQNGIFSKGKILTHKIKSDNPKKENSLNLIISRKKNNIQIIKNGNILSNFSSEYKDNGEISLQTKQKNSFIIKQFAIAGTLQETLDIQQITDPAKVKNIGSCTILYADEGIKETLFLFYYAYLIEAKESGIIVQKSDNEGKNWSEPIFLIPENYIKLKIDTFVL